MSHASTPSADNNNHLGLIISLAIVLSGTAIVALCLYRRPRAVVQSNTGASPQAGGPRTFAAIRVGEGDRKAPSGALTPIGDTTPPTHESAPQFSSRA